MNTKSKCISVALAAALISSTFIPSLHAKPPEGDWEEMREHREKKHEKIMEELNLNPEQKEQIKNHHQEHREKRKALRKEMTALRKHLGEELEKTTTNHKKIDEITSKIKKLHAEQIDQRVESILAMKEILTPEQFKQLKEKRKELKEQRKKRFKKKRGRRIKGR